LLDKAICLSRTLQYQTNQRIMPDIAMCKGDNCPLKEKCYRFIARPSEYGQTWFTEPPIKDGECDRFWDATKLINYKHGA